MPSEPTLLAIFTVIMTLVIGPAFILFLNRKKTGIDLAQSAINMNSQLMERFENASQKILDLEATVEKLKTQKTAPIHVDVFVRRDGPELHATATAEYLIESE